MAGDEKLAPSDKKPRTPAAGARDVDPLVEQATARIGTTLLGKWRLDVLLGVGGAAAVYAGTHRNGSRAAIKILHREMAANPFVLEQFLWEGYIANAVSHEGAVRVLDDDIAEDGSHFLVTELLDGETLEERRLRLGGRLPQAEVLVALDVVLDVLAVAHEHHIVHRDLKPENVFLTRDGRVKVIDFGIARLREESGSAPQRLPEGRAIVGTPAFMPPEHARGHFDDVDERSDLWACGAMMFRLLSGRSVHEAHSAHEELASAMTLPAPSLERVAPDVHARVARVVDKALAFSKELRWPDARSMQSALREAYEEAYGGPLSAAPRLVVEERVTNRTLPPLSASGAFSVRWGPSTIRPTSFSRADLGPRELAAGRSKKPAIWRGLALGLAVVAAWAFVGWGRSTDERRSVSGAVQHLASTAEPPVVSIEPLPMPDLSLCALPEASARVQAPLAVVSPPPVQRPSPAPASPAPPVNAPARGADCIPPYVYEPGTGKKVWKLECL